MALRRDDPYTALAQQYLSRGEPEEPRRPTLQRQEPAEPTAEQIERTRRERSAAQTSETEKAFDVGLQGIRASGYAARGLARQIAGDEQGGRRDLERSVEINEEAERYGPRVRNVDDVTDVGTSLEYARNLAAEQIPNIALLAGTGGLGGVLRTGAGRAATNIAARQVGERVAARAAGEAAASRVAVNRATQTAARRLATDPVREAAQRETAQKLAAAATGSVLQAGQVAPAALDETQDPNARHRAAKAAVGAVATGALETLPVMSLLRRYGLAPAAEAAERVATGGLVRRLAVNAAKQGAAESATEVAQTVGELATHKWINDNVSLVDDDALDQYVNAAVGGGLGGAIFGAPAGLRGGTRGPSRERIQAGLKEGWDSVRGKLGEAVAPAAATARAAGGSIRERFNRHLAEQRDKTEFASAFEDLNTEPFGFSEQNGEAVIGGAPLSGFINPERSRALEERYPAAGKLAARLISPVEDEGAVERLYQSGAVESAVRAFRGDDLGKFTQNERAALNEYLDALPETARRGFRRTMATMEAMAQRGLLERDDNGRLSEAYVYTPESAGPLARASETEDTSTLDSELDTTQRPSRPLAESVFRAARGNQVRGGNPTDTIVMRNEAGERRRVNMSAAIQALRQDQDFAQSLREVPGDQRMQAEIAGVLGQLQEQGWQAEPESIRGGLQLARGAQWTLDQATADRIRAGLGDAAGRAAVAARAAPVQPRQRATGIDARMDQDQEQGVEVDQDRGAIERVPLRAGTQVGESRVARDLPVDTAALRQENQPTNTVADNTNRLDELIANAGVRRPQTPAAREVAVKQLRSRLQGEELDAFNQRVLALAEAGVQERMARAEAARSELAELQRVRERNPELVPPTDLREAADAVQRADRQLAAARRAADRERRQVRPQRAAGVPTEGRGTAAYVNELRRSGLEERSGQIVNRRTGRPVNARLQQSIRERVARGAGLRFDDATAAEEMRAYFQARREARQAQSVPQQPLRFQASIDQLLSSEQGAQTIIRELPDIRSRVSIFALMEALERSDQRASQWATSVMEAVMQRDSALAAEVGASRGPTVQRMIDTGAVKTVDDALRTESLEIVNTILDGSDTYSDMLGNIRQFATPEQQRLLDQLVSSGAIAGVTLDVVPSQNSYTTGSYLSHEDKIVLRLPFVQNGQLTNDAIATILHEAVHAATVKAEARNARYRRDLNQLLNHVRAQVQNLGEDPAGWYGLSDTQEFLAEAFTNPVFQELLESVPAAQTDTYRNAWEQFKDFVRRILGMTNVDPTALDEIITLGGIGFDQTASLRQQGYTSLFDGDAVGSFNSQHAEEPTDWVAMLPPDARARLLSAFEVPAVKRQIKANLPENVRGLVDTADVGPTLLVNAGVAMHLNGQLDLDSADRGVVRQLWDQISAAIKVPSANVYGKQILADIKSGYLKEAGHRYDPVQRTLVKNPGDRIGRAAVSTTRWMQKHVQPVADALLKSMNSRLRETGIPALRELSTLIAQRTGEFRADSETSYRQRWETERSQRLNQLGRHLEGLTPQQERVLVRALQTGNLPAKHAALRAKYDALRSYLDGMYDYMDEAGVEGLRRRENFFPVQMDATEVERRRDQFFELHRAPNFDRPIRERFVRWTEDELNRLPKDNLSEADMQRRDALEARIRQLRDPDAVPIDDLIGQLYDMAVYGGREHYIAGVNFADSAHKPAFSSLKPRTSDFIYEFGTPEQIRAFSKFQKTNLAGILVNYTNRAVRRAEWEAMDLTPQINALLEQAAQEGATPQQLQMAQDYLNMEMGTYNDNWNPVVARVLQGADKLFGTNLAQTDFQKAKSVMSVLATYNNIRLLPLALASSFVDPLATMVRSGGVKDAFANLKDAARAMRSEGGDELRAMAEEMGIVERAGLGDIMAHLYGGVYDSDSKLGKINSTLFKYNGLEYMLRYTRLTALAAGHRFLIRHATNPNQHSERYLAELGLTPADIRVDPSGRFVELTPQVEAALRRFVDESTVRPTPGQKPSWHNDPNFSLAAQYKGYVYAFYETVLQRAYNEMREGNPAVLAPMLAYLPLTLAAEMMRDMVQGDGDDKDAEDYMVQTVNRSGLLGPRSAAVQDATTNFQYGTGLLGNFAGPTGQQIGDAYDVVTGNADASSFAVEALPGQALYREWGD